jgi:ABC-type thiamin/hydroxymethylpyrimidine transport system permease subunit
MQALSGIHFWRQYSFLSDHTSSFGLTAGAFIQTYIYGRMLSTHEALLILLSTRFTTAFGRVITHFSVAKLVCSRARLKSLGQWRSFTNLPSSSLWF